MEESAQGQLARRQLDSLIARSSLGGRDVMQMRHATSREIRAAIVRNSRSTEGNGRSGHLERG